jgi:Streptomyces sporulation and cell division protein, SsgA
MNGDQSGLRDRRTVPQGPPALSLRIQRWLGEGAEQSVRAEFRFDPEVPMIVSITFTPGHGPSVIWHIGREVLAHGLHEDSGEGDVQVWPSEFHDHLAWLMLESRGVGAFFQMPVQPLADWLDATYEAVPEETEMDTLDWDGFIAELLASPEPEAD